MDLELLERVGHIAENCSMGKFGEGAWMGVFMSTAESEHNTRCSNFEREELW
jgi:hypothetical protein